MISLDVIQLASGNGVHLLCLPAHMTHLLQPLDISVFKSLKSNFSAVCKKYISDEPGRVVTTDALASLLGQAWPQSVTPINAMSGFRKYVEFIHLMLESFRIDRWHHHVPLLTQLVIQTSWHQDNITPKLEKLY